MSHGPQGWLSALVYLIVMALGVVALVVTFIREWLHKHRGGSAPFDADEARRELFWLEQRAPHQIERKKEG